MRKTFKRLLLVTTIASTVLGFRSYELGSWSPMKAEIRPSVCAVSLSGLITEQPEKEIR